MTDTAHGQPQFPGGEYLIEGQIGVGGMAVVYKARDTRRPRMVAIKVLRAEVAQVIGTERFRREIRLASGLNHPNILPLLDSGEAIDADGRPTPYFVMPLVEGESLQERLRRESRFPLDLAIRIGREVLDALQYAHSRGVIHRDIKPANILLSADHAVITDFGVARPIPGSHSMNESSDSLTLSGFAVGTPAYMSPEQAVGDAQLDVRSDLYSVGCLLYEMVVGAPPFEAPTAQSVIARKLNGMFVPASVMRPSVPPVLDDLMQRALAPEPADRFASAAEFAHALTLVESNTPTSVAATPARRRSVSRRVAVVLGIMLLAAAGATLMNKPWARVADAQPLDKAHVAVLPLEAPASDSSLHVIAAGLTADLIDELSQYPALSVISRNGVRAVGADLSPDSIARFLSVGSIVTGDVRRSGDSVIIAVRLVDGESSVQVAQATAGARIGELLAVRSSMLDSVTSFLRTSIGQQLGDTQRRTVRNPEAWGLVAQAKSMIEGELNQSAALTVEQRNIRFAVAESLLAHAVRLDESWPVPYVQWAALMLQRARVEDNAAFRRSASDTSALPDVSTFRRDAVRLAEEAMRRSSDDTEARYTRGKARLELWRTSNPAPESLRSAAETDLRYAVGRRRNMAQAWNDLSFLLQMSGNYSESRRAAEEALRADAFLERPEVVVARLLFTSLGSGDPEAARAWCDQGAQRFPDFPAFWGCQLTILGWTGSTPADVAQGWRLLATSEARDSSNVLSQGWGTRRLLVAAIAARAGLHDSARAIAAAVRDSATSGAAALQADYGEAYVRTLLGEHDVAVRLLDNFLAANPALRGQVRHTPWFRALRSNARFIAITSP